MKTKFTLLALCFALGTFAQTVTVTNTNDYGPGSFRQAILDANANQSVDTIDFDIPNTDPNYNSTTGVYTISVTIDKLPIIKNHNLVIDGTSQAVNRGNSNTYQFGTGGTVGVDDLPLSKVEGPEIEIIDNGGFSFGLAIERDSNKVLGLALSGFGNSWYSASDANILVRKGARHAHIEACVLGSEAHTAMAPATDINAGSNFQAINGSDSGTFVNNFVAYGEYMGGLLKNNVTGWTITNNEFYSNSLGSNISDGLDLADNTFRNRVVGNLFKENGGAGFDSYNSTGGHYIENNTSVGNGQRNVEKSGMRIYGTLADTITKNRLYQNVGAGIMVVSGAKRHIISKNSIYQNGNIIASSGSATTNQIGIDLLKGTDSHVAGTHPFYTINDDQDGDYGANTLLNFPVITSAVISGGNLTVKGFAPAGATIEFFKGDLFSGAVYPQGKTYLFSAVEGASSDADATTGTYGPGNVNGIPQGTETNANRFEFTVPAPVGCSASDIITATATIAGKGTSEFGGGLNFTVQATPPLTPNLECVYIDVNGDIVARWGYSNSSNSTVNEPVGSDNRFTPGGNNQGQPTSFAAGLNNNVFTTTFNSAQSRTWKLQGTSVTADINSIRCPADLAVGTWASNNTPNIGDQVTINVYVANLTAGTPATAIEIGNMIDPNFSVISATPTAGTYNSSTGVWSIPQVLFGAHQRLTFVVKVNGTGTLTASVNSQNQPDPNSANNSASETLSCNGGSSGGNNGGIESEGSMASLIAQRNFTRVRTGAHKFYDHINDAPTMREYQSGRMEKSASLASFVPVSGPQNSQAIVTSPTDLIGITNALSVLSADYYKANQQRLGAVLAMETQSEVYNHTKIICDRLNGATLSEISHVTVDGHSFLMTRLDQDNGEIDYAVTFVVYEENGNYTVDNRYALGEYEPENNGKIYNFQVWSVSPSITVSIIEDIISNIEGSGSVDFINIGNPPAPTVYVEKGDYKNGALTLEIVNTVGASELTLEASSISSETENRSYFNTTIALDPTKTKETVVWNTGYIFDAGFSLTNNMGGGKDVLYFADGPWGVDYEKNIGVRNAMWNVNPETGYTPQANEMHLERNASFSGNMKNYVSIYRMLRPGNRTMDLSQFNQVSFDASLSGMSQIVVTLVSNSIENWHDQFRTTVGVSNSGTNTYTVDFSNLASLAGGKFQADDIINITFSVIGDQNNFQAMSIDVSNVVFSGNGNVVSLDEEKLDANNGLSVYPNPFSTAANIDVEVAKSGNVHLELYDLSGKMIDYQDLGYQFEGVTSFTYQPSRELKDGIYLMKVVDPIRTTTQRVVVKK